MDSQEGFVVQQQEQRLSSPWWTGVIQGLTPSRIRTPPDSEHHICVFPQIPPGSFVVCCFWLAASLVDLLMFWLIDDV